MIDQSAGPVPLAEVVGGLLELSDLLDGQRRMRLAAYREGYQIGHDAGYAEGRQDMADELAEAWNTIARTATRGVPLTELERRRWGPSGRERFGDPRPGDYRGRGAA